VGNRTARATPDTHNMAHNAKSHSSDQRAARMGRLEATTAEIRMLPNAAALNATADLLT